MFAIVLMLLGAMVIGTSIKKYDDQDVWKENYAICFWDDITIDSSEDLMFAVIQTVFSGSLVLFGFLYRAARLFPRAMTSMANLRRRLRKKVIKVITTGTTRDPESPRATFWRVFVAQHLAVVWIFGRCVQELFGSVLAEVWMS